MTSRDAHLLRRHGYEPLGLAWVRYLPAGPESQGVRVALWEGEEEEDAEWHLRARVIARGREPSLLVAVAASTLKEALLDPGLAALEAALSLGTPLEGLVEASTQGR